MTSLKKKSLKFSALNKRSILVMNGVFKQFL